MQVSQAHLRVATQQESDNARGGTLYKWVARPFWYGLGYLGKREYLSNQQEYFHSAEPPIPLRIWNSVKSFFCDAGPLKRYPNLLFDHVQIDDAVVLEEFLKHHRNDITAKDKQTLKPSFSMLALAAFLKKCFPSLTANQLINVCAKDETFLFHKMLRTVLSPDKVKNYLPAIQNQVQISFNTINHDDLSTPTNVTEITRSYFTRIFGENIFGNCDSGVQLNEHLNTLKRFISRKASNQLTREDAVIEEQLIQDIRKTTQEILNNNPDLFSDIDLEDDLGLRTDEAKCALFFFMLFAAQDNTVTFLTAALWYLSAHPERQESLRSAAQRHQENPTNRYPEELQIFFAEIGKDYAPVFSIARIAANDLCLDYKFGVGSPMRKAIIFKGEIIVGRIDRVAQKIPLTIENLPRMKPFGSGPNKCPGKYFADAGMKEFLIHALANYQMELFSPTELLYDYTFTTIPKEDIQLFFEKIK